ncbi:monooxygenase [Podospora aff. communis PSN243]|uniref:Monooxygenase n=1 Tax=Podospora aff. communis PSN243 TaxID=3040156 RepID=A0AAV9H3L9_9PEZI|nr:monooxygenase [Podospora aff. communis PSN243]
MKLLQLTTLAGAVLAVPADLSSRQTCSSPKLRKSWSKATAAEKTAYINAALCLVTKPSRLKVKDHSTLYDDFSYVHARLTKEIHSYAVFLPWHRYFVHVYENALRECGYTGTAMYWDWVADSAAPSRASVWDPVLGFGGNGVSTGDNGPRKRVIDGPFKNLRPVYWSLDVQPHWLSRDWTPADPASGRIEISGHDYTPAIMNSINAETKYDDFRYRLESGPHAAVHGGVGGGNRGLGDLGFHDASPNDPLFFLHHTQVDRLWWLWQQQNPSARTMAYEGTRPLPDGLAGPPATLNDPLLMAGLAPDGIVRDYMDVKGGKLCYTY